MTWESTDGEMVMPLAGEEIAVTKRVVDTRRVGVHRITRQHTEAVAEPLVDESVEIVRVPIGREVSAAPPIHEDGDTLVIPILEERMVVERRLFLKEEVRVKRVRTSSTHHENVTLRHHEVVLTSLAVPAPSDTECVSPDHEVTSHSQGTGEAP